MRHVLYTLVLFGFLGCTTSKGVELRIKNESGEIFSALDLTLFGKTYHFTNLGAGDSTQPIAVDSAYRYHYAKAVTSTDTLICQPIDFVGETAVKNGKVTLGLRIDTINGERSLIFTHPSLATVSKELYEGHTTAADVLDNLFVSVNYKDWSGAQSYYAKEAVVRDGNNTMPLGDPVAYFKNLFSGQQVSKILLSSVRKEGGQLHVQAVMHKGSGSAEYPLCLVFAITGNRITEQSTEPCGSDVLIPTATKPSSEHDAALLQGRLEEKGGCLTVDGRVLVWPYGYTARRGGNRIMVLNAEGAEVARTGTLVKLSGGGIEDVRKALAGDVDFKGLPCTGKGWFVGRVETIQK